MTKVQSQTLSVASMAIKRVVNELEPYLPHTPSKSSLKYELLGIATRLEELAKEHELMDDDSHSNR